MAIQIEGNQIQNGVISFAKLASADIETTLTGASNKLARADAIKAYVDNVAAGIHWKDSVKVATTANITLSGEQTIDGITTSSSRVLVKNQTNAAQNGIWISASGAWSRASDMNDASEFPGAAVFVREGSSQEDTGYVCTNDSEPDIGSTDITFAQFTGINITAGDGLDQTGSTLSVNVDDSSIEISADALQVKALGITAGMLAGGIGNAKLSNSTISGVALGSNLNSLSVVTGSALAMTSYNGSAARSDLAVQVDGASIEISSNALQVKAAGISATMLAGSIPADKLQLGNGVESDAGVLKVDLDGSSLALGESGLKVADNGVTNAMLANSTISGVSLGGTLNSLSAGNGISMTSYNGSAAVSDLTVNLDGSTLSVSASGLKVADSAIGETQLSNSAVTNAKLAGSIAADKLQLGNGVESDAGVLKVDLDGSSLALGESGLKVSDTGIGTDQIADSAVTNDKLSGSIGANKLAGSIPADKLNLGNGVQDNGGNLQIDIDGSTLALSVNGVKVADAGIGETQLANEAVKPAKCGFFSQWDVLTANGSSVDFDLSYTIDQTFASIIVIRNGLVVKQVESSPTGQDEFSLNLTGGAGGVSRISFGSAPTNGSDLRVWYMA